MVFEILLKVTKWINWVWFMVKNGIQPTLRGEIPQKMCFFPDVA